VLADEPTGNLDEATANIVFDEFLRWCARRRGRLVATHNERLAARMDRVLRLHDGPPRDPAAGACGTGPARDLKAAHALSADRQ
jgi:ABC-type lipoprotein export system ATPase subunit